MALMCKEQHLDAEPFRYFLRTRLWEDFAARFMKPEQHDAVDLNALEALLPPQPVWLNATLACETQGCYPSTDTRSQGVSRSTRSIHPRWRQPLRKHPFTARIFFTSARHPNIVLAGSTCSSTQTALLVITSPTCMENCHVDHPLCASFYSYRDSYRRCHPSGRLRLYVPASPHFFAGFAACTYPGTGGSQSCVGDGWQWRHHLRMQRQGRHAWADRAGFRWS